MSTESSAQATPCSLKTVPSSLLPLFCRRLASWREVCLLFCRECVLGLAPRGRNFAHKPPISSPSTLTAATRPRASATSTVCVDLLPISGYHVAILFLPAPHCTAPISSLHTRAFRLWTCPSRIR